MNIATIRAWKPTEDVSGSLSACNKDDPDATQFDVHYAGAFFASSCISRDSLREAEEIVRVCHAVHEAGKKAAKAELREWLGGR